MFTLNEKDLVYAWFSGTGAGGQHRNKHQNCLRLKHLPTNIQVTAQNHRDRPSNEREALEKLTARVKSFLHPEVQKERFRAKETIRSYRETDNLVKDHASGKTGSYKDIVLDADPDSLERMMEFRRNAIIEK
jgi:protein subunit release factor A